MAESLYVNADWSALVPAGSPEAAFGVAPVDAARLGLLPPEPETNEAPEPEPEPEAKQATKAANKQAKRPADK